MDEAIKYLLAQGVLGVFVVAQGVAIWWLLRENRRLYDRIEAKSDTNSKVNQDLAKSVTEAFAVAMKHRRRPPTRPVE